MSMITAETLMGVLLGSAAGGVARFQVGAWVTQLTGTAFPWGTLVVNVSGALAAGVLIALWPFDHTASPGLFALMMLGFLGSYTTVSSFALQTLNLAQQGRSLQAAGNVLASGTACLGAAWLGYQLTMLMAGHP
ncbi:CrcB family protein [Ectothiorhodospira sp. BSL-9]|uniref:fluoride efflux transporter FluC n=1 Tax=Ectothiorhodospira sp. BSL-9 TaxID=1442136 RepID=UPI0007B42F56|nr:CrcB family protein [Ectothiorhodospira sp. BSL-9]ANB01948.1 hypothetical protein ECTOBSL9_1193 [Ectothiorhodospira sp. BSL-9]